MTLTILDGEGAGRRFLLLLSAFLILFFGAWLFIWLERGPLYYMLAHGWGMHTVPWRFADILGVLSWNDCALLGHDVYVENPCAPVNVPLNYSPFLLDLPLERIGVRNALLAGAMQNAIFLIVLPFVLQPKTMTEFLVAMLACASSAVLFALERSNLDLLLFVFAAVMGLLPLANRHARLLSYAIAFFSGLLKFYPFVLLGGVLREKPKRFLFLGGILATGLAAYVFHYGPSIERALARMPNYNAYSSNFGASTFPNDIVHYIGLPGLAAPLLLTGLLVAALFLAIFFARRILAVTGPDTWQETPYRHLAHGALLICGVFLLQQNFYYRAIFLLLLLPGFFALMRHRPLARLMTAGITLILLCLWEETVRIAVHDALLAIHGHTPDSVPENLPAVFHFAFRELCWWLLIALNAGVLLAFARQSPLGTYAVSMSDRIWRRKAAA